MWENTRRAQIIPNDPNFFRITSSPAIQMTKVTDSDSEVSVTMWHLARARDAVFRSRLRASSFLRANTPSSVKVDFPPSHLHGGY
jgi:hypothetical protein